MKKLLLSFAVLALLASCSDDNGNDNGNGGDGNQPGQPALFEKKITKVVMTLTGYDNEDNFTYDAKGRLASWDDDKVVYGENKVEFEDGTYTLENGQVTKYVYNDEYDNYTCEYTYKDGYLSKISDITGGYTDDYDYTFEKGNLVKCVNTWLDEDGGETEEDISTVNFTYGKQPNSMNLDLMDILFEISPEGEYLLGIAGKRSANLPEKVVSTYTEWNDTPVAPETLSGKRDIQKVLCEETGVIEYTTDKEGYITKVVINVTHKEDGKVVSENSILTFTITYGE